MATNHPYPTALHQQATTLKQQGVPTSDIAHRLGVAESTVVRWLSPHHAALNRLRSRQAKHRRKTRCPGCGKPIWYTSKACPACTQHRYWTKERVKQAIQAWADNHHGQPPTATEWMRKGDNHPAATGIYGPKGVYQTWNEAIADAGFTPRRSSPGPGRRTWSSDEAWRLRHAGVTDVEIARRFGVSASAIYQRLGPRGKNNPKQPPRTREQRIEALRYALQHQ